MYKTDKIVYVTVAATTIFDIPAVVFSFVSDAETTIQNPLYFCKSSARHKGMRPHTMPNSIELLLTMEENYNNKKLTKDQTEKQAQQMNLGVWVLELQQDFHLCCIFPDPTERVGKKARKIRRIFVIPNQANQGGN